MTYSISIVFRPGRWKNEQRELLVKELREVAADCFDSIPEYQCLSGQVDVLEKCVISLARNQEGRLVGFCSSLLLPVDGVGDVLHLGLTCVGNECRGAGLTHKLSSAVVTNMLIRNPFRKIWISNVACVLSSLGNVARYFQEVYPSCWQDSPPYTEYSDIARSIDSLYRKEIHIRPEATFNEDTFVFEGSTIGTVFKKSAQDRTYYHRESYLNNFYLNILNFGRGDEVLQVGYISISGMLNYFLRRQLRKIPVIRDFIKFPVGNAIIQKVD